MERSLDLSKIDVMEMLETLGLRNLTDEGDEAHFSCPLSGHLHGDANPSAYMNKKTTAWLCHGCHAKGNAVSFLCQVYSISPLEATRALRNEFDNEFKEPATSMRNELESLLKASEAKPLPTAKYLDESVLERFKLTDRGREYAEHRGFTEGTISDWEFGYDSFSDRLTFPIRNQDGKLIGVKGRTIKDNPAKYIAIGGDKYGFPTYEMSQILFGINKYVENECKDMILCEGEFNAIALWQKGFDGAVAINGSHISETHIKNIKRHAKSIVLFFDSDEAGFSATAQAIEALEAFMPVKLVPDHEGDPADMSIGKIRQCLKDAESSMKLFIPEI